MSLAYVRRDTSDGPEWLAGRDGAVFERITAKIPFGDIPDDTPPRDVCPCDDCDHNKGGIGCATKTYGLGRCDAYDAWRKRN